MRSYSWLNPTPAIKRERGRQYHKQTKGRTKKLPYYNLFQRQDIAKTTPQKPIESLCMRRLLIPSPAFF